MANSLRYPDVSDCQQFEVRVRAVPLRRPVRWLAVLLMVWCASGVYEWAHLKRGWVPWDAGAYAQSAERVLGGQLPHRDFVEVYTGGLTYLNAAAMRIFGTNLTAERMMLFVFFIAWIPALYWIASQFCRDWIAGALVFLATAWSVPNYSEAVPSWYNLFFATFGVAALLAYVKRPSWKWLVMAGACGGLSLLAKSVGLCYVAGVLLFLVFREQSVAQQIAITESGDADRVAHANDPLGQKRRWRIGWYSAFVLASLTAFLILLARLVFQLPESGDIVLFLEPSAALCTLLAWNEFEMPSVRLSRKRFADLLRTAVPFGAGAVAPILIFLAPYIQAHALGLLLHDLFVQASSRVAMVHAFPDDTITIIPTICLTAALAISSRLNEKWRGILIASIAGLFAFGLIYGLFNYDAYIGIWSTAYWIVPVLTAAVCFLLARRRLHRENPAAQQRIFLLVSVTALCSLVEFPFSSPIYFCYVAPLVILTLAAVLESFPHMSKAILTAAYAVFLIYVIFEVTPGFIYPMGYSYSPETQTASLDYARAGGLRVDPESASIYNELIPLVRAHAGDDEIYSGPDAPEVYFLAGYANPTPYIYDFLSSSTERHEQINRLLANPKVRVIVLNTTPALSSPPSETLQEKIARQFPHGEMVGNFEVRWRK